MKSIGTGTKKPDALEMSPELKAVQDLMPMSPEDLARLTADIKKNGVRHPVIVYRKDGVIYVLAGWHRREIARGLGLMVPIEEIEGTPKEYKEFCIMENLARRHLTTAQKENIAREFFKIKPEASARSIAEKLGISPTTASKIKGKSVVQSGHLPVKGKDGKTYGNTPKPSPARIAEPPRKAQENTPVRVPEAPRVVSLETRLADYAGDLDERAARLKEKANLEKKKNTALMMIGEARALAIVADEIMKIINE